MTEPYQPYQDPQGYQPLQPGHSQPYPPYQDSRDYQPLQPGYGQPYPPAAPEHPQGTAILVLGILGILVVGICGPFAWHLGSNALKEGRASGVHYANEQSIVIGRVLGIVATVLLILCAVPAAVFLFVFLYAATTFGH